jgi:hypothetical protein
VFPPSAGAMVPSAAIGTLFNVKHYLMLMTVQDPLTMAQRNVMATWNEKEWVLTSQESTLTYISTQKVESKFQVWGTDGTSLFPLFAQPSLTLTKRLDTKSYGNDSIFLVKDFRALYLVAQDLTQAQLGINCTVELNMSGLSEQSIIDPSVPTGVYGNIMLATPSFKAPPPGWSLWAGGTVGLPFVSVSARLITTSPDFAIGNLALGYTDEVAII